MPRSRHRKKRARKDRRSRGRSHGEGFLLVESPEKMSAILLDFIRPYLEPGYTRDDMKWFVTAGALAWNLALLPEPERASFLASKVPALQRNSPEWTGFLELLSELVKRKLRYYAENRRFILDYTVLDQGDRLRVLVLSTVSEPEAKHQPPLSPSAAESARPWPPPA